MAVLSCILLTIFLFFWFGFLSRSFLGRSASTSNKGRVKRQRHTIDFSDRIDTFVDAPESFSMWSESGENSSSSSDYSSSDNSFSSSD
jgi:hypothetical protein